MRTAFSVLLFVLAGLLTPQVAGQQQPVQLDMAPNAFDDQYVCCIEKMEIIAPQLLEDTHRIFTRTIKQIKDTISYSSQLNDFHGTALVAYTGAIAIDFNRAVRNFTSNDAKFYFKGYHYYLTRALQLLGSSKCHTVYRGSKTRFSYSSTGNIQFGQFTSSSLDRNIAMKYRGDSGTLFIITSCLSVHIEAFSLDPKEKEVLIPGYEVYQKVKVTKTSYETYNTIELKDPKTMKSNFNCFYKNYDSNFNGAGVAAGSLMRSEVYGHTTLNAPDLV